MTKAPQRAIEFDREYWAGEKITVRGSLIKKIEGEDNQVYMVERTAVGTPNMFGTNIQGLVVREVHAPNGRLEPTTRGPRVEPHERIKVIGKIEMDSNT